MPTVQGIDNFNHGDFTVPGGASYNEIVGTPAKDTTIRHGSDPASLLIDQTSANFFFGGTSILIVVGVALDTMKQLEAQLMMRNYEGFLK